MTEREERGCFQAFLVLVLVALVIFALIVATLWVGHFLLFGLLPSPHEWQHHAHGQLGREYPLGWLRGIAMFMIVVSVIGVAAGAITTREPLMIGLAVAVVLAMAISAVVESSGNTSASEPASSAATVTSTGTETTSSSPTDTTSTTPATGGSSSASFCSTHRCIANFDNGTGYIVQCADGEWSHSGGRRGACRDHGGETSTTSP